MEKPHIEWTPFAFALLATVIATLVLVYPNTNQVAQAGAIGIATTLAGAAAGAYAGGRSKTNSDNINTNP